MCFEHVNPSRFNGQHSGKAYAITYKGKKTFTLVYYGVGFLNLSYGRLDVFFYIIVRYSIVTLTICIIPPLPCQNILAKRKEIKEIHVLMKLKWSPTTWLKWNCDCNGHIGTLIMRFSVTDYNCLLLVVTHGVLPPTLIVNLKVFFIACELIKAL